MLTRDDLVREAAPDSEPFAAAAAAADNAVLRAFGPLAMALREGADPEDLLRLASAEMAALVGVPRCLAYLRNDRADTFRGVVAHGAREERVRMLVSGFAADGLTREILRTRVPVCVENAQGDPRTVLSSMRAWDVRSVLGVPIMDCGHVLGLFYLDVPGEQHDFDVETRARAAAFAELSAFVFVQARIGAEARAGRRRARAQITNLIRILAVEDRLWAALLEGAGERRLTQILADLTDCSWALYTPTGERVAAAAPGEKEGGAPVPDLASLGVLDRPGVRAVLDGSEPRAETVGPIRELGPQRRLLCAAAGGAAGRRLLVAVERGRRLGTLDSVLARRAAVVFAARALEGSGGATSSGSTRAAELAALLRGEVDASDSAFHTALDLPLDLRAAVCVLAGSPAAVNSERVAAAVREALPECAPIVTATAAGTAVLIEVPAAIEGIVVRLRAACRLLAGKGSLHVGVSDPVDGLAACPRAYEDALDVIACIDALGDAPAKGAIVLAADDLGCARSLLAGAGRDGAERFVHRTLGPLLGPSARHLLLTLEQMAEHAWNFGDVAEALGKHENTIRYRVGRIEAVSGLAIRSDARAQMEARMALLVMDVQRRVAGG